MKMVIYYFETYVNINENKKIFKNGLRMTITIDYT